ncbi:PAS domain S-box [Halogeometricum borinquense DSM 11551]|uniref:histidine kinase n=2 Tax=Halogeometricum borinquense TaxID=60847 RepID=L9ULU1_HALBP|nr:PAS domain S-box [Halogeometricum borinquense DSM 11551]
MMVQSDRPIHVLHVDDEPDFATLAADFLERENDSFVVETATTAGAGLDVLATEDIDCVVSDYDMPEQNGIEFLNAVREDYPSLPFILFTGKGSESIASDAISAGVTDYLQKQAGTGQYKLLANRIKNVVSQYRAEQQATKTERRLQELSEASNDVLWMFSSDWDELLYINSAYEDIWGRSTETLAAQPRDFLHGVHPDDREQVTAAMNQLSNGNPADLEYRVNEDENYQRWIWVQAEPITDSAGTVTRIAGFARDITERKKRERTLRQERMFIDQALNALDDAFYVINPDGTMRRWNETALERTGYTDAEISEMQAIEFFPEDERERVGEAIEEALTTGSATVEANVLTKHGEYIPHEFTGARLTDPEGNLTGLVGIARDISERKAQQERFQAFIENSTDIIVVLDEDGTYLYQSPSVEHVLGYEPEALLGENAFEYIHPEDRQEVMETFSEAVSNPEMTPTVECRFRHKDGSWRWIEAVGNNQLDNPAVEGFVINSRDITERKKHEQEL